MKSLFILPSLLFSIFSLSAQPVIEWQKCLGGSDVDHATSIQQTSDGGYVVAGRSLSINGDIFGNHGGDDFWVAKLNNVGEKEWQKALGGSKHDWCYSIQQTSDGGYILAGFTESNNGNVSGNHGDIDYWVVKLNSVGAIQWQRALGGSLWDEAWFVQQTTDGGYIVAGGSNSLDGDVTGNHGAADFWIVKLGESGVIEWQKSLGGSMGEIAYSVRQTYDGGYIVTGAVGSDDGDVTGFHGSTDYWVVKLSSSGDLEWQKALGTNSLDRANDVWPTSDGGYIVVGEVSANNGDVTGHHGGYDYWVAKLNATGQIEWQKALGGSSEEFARSVQQTADGGYVIAGATLSTNGDVQGNDGGVDFWVVKLTEEGSLQWQKTLGGIGGDWANSIHQTSDGGYIVAGYTTSNDGDVSGFHGIQDYWVVKLSPESVGVGQTPSTMGQLEMFPSPAAGSIFIKTDSEGLALSVLITDLLGRELSRQRVLSGGSIDISALPKGLYLLTAIALSGQGYSGKFVKE